MKRKKKKEKMKICFGRRNQGKIFAAAEYTLRKGLRTEEDIKGDKELMDFLEYNNITLQEFDLYCLMKYFDICGVKGDERERKID